ncbi:MAG: MFS transporter [Brumimicrobium sp.]|nr:MFS transporter [Brumimicrobium sp.]
MSKTWLTNFDAENQDFWENQGGENIAWKTLWITTGALTFSFATWFIMSVLVVKLNGIGFKFTSDQLFWLAAMPGLSGGIFRIINTFLLPIYGTRHIVSFTTFLKILPCVGIGFAVMDTSTPFWIFMILAFLTGIGGGDFSSYMPSTNLFFPRRLKGTALGLQAGIGNFGVSLVQFITPILIGVGVVGTSSQFTNIDAKEVEEMFIQLGEEQVTQSFMLLDKETQILLMNKFDQEKAKMTFHENIPSEPIDFFAGLPVSLQAKSFTYIHPKKAEAILTSFQTEKNGVKNSTIYLQNSAFWFIPFLIIIGIVSWISLRSIPMKASFKEQLDIFGDKHTWYCTLVYLMTFGGFAGLSAAFPMLIKSVYGGFPDAPDPLMFAFYGPLIGSASRVLFGFAADRFGGGVLTTISGIGLTVGTILLVSMGLLTPNSLDQFPMFVGIMLSLFFFTGIGNASTFRQFPIIFQHNPRQAAGVIGWTAGVAAFGPFIFSMLILLSMNVSGNSNAFFIGLIIFSVIATFVNWNFYHKKGCVRPS